MAFLKVFLLSIFLAFTLCSLSEGYNFIVGGKNGWSLHPSQSYSNWANSLRFQVNDTLAFKYNKETDSVVVVTKHDYKKCNAAKPVQKMDGGDSVFKFDQSGLYYFITGNKSNCDQGQKLIILVLAVRSKSPTTPSVPAPTPAPESIVPVASPESIVPVASPESIVPVPSPESIVPVPSPENIVPVPSPGNIVPVPSPETIVPSPSPTSDVPAVSPAPVTPGPKVSPAPVTPGPAANAPGIVPTPSPFSPGNSPADSNFSPAPAPSKSYAPASSPTMLVTVVSAIVAALIAFA